MSAAVDDRYVLMPPPYKEMASQLPDIDELTIIRELGGGAPETKVYLVDVKKSAPSHVEGSWVLKIDSTSRARIEIANNTLIADTTLGKYVPRLQYAQLGKSDDSLSVALYALATGTLLNSRTLESSIKSSTRAPAAVIGNIAKILVSEWNEQCEYRVVDLWSSLDKERKRITLECAGLVEHLNALVDLTSLRIEGEPLNGRWLANTIALLNGRATFSTAINRTVPMGHVHGDLHPGNALHTNLGKKSRSSIAFIASSTPNSENFSLTNVPRLRPRVD